MTRCLLWTEEGDGEEELMEKELRSAWRDLSFSWEREQPITVCPRLANSRARAFPNPLLTPVISTVRWVPGTLAAMLAVLWPPTGGGAVIYYHSELFPAFAAHREFKRNHRIGDELFTNLTFTWQKIV